MSQRWRRGIGLTTGASARFQEEVSKPCGSFCPTCGEPCSAGGFGHEGNHDHWVGDSLKAHAWANENR
jgi:hypothetical protein